MKKLITTPEDRKIEIESRQYLRDRVGVYPAMLQLVLTDNTMADIKKKLKNKKKLNTEEQNELYKNYLNGQREFKTKCNYIADWATFNGELLFLDVLGTDVANGIYETKIEDFEKMTKLFDELPEEIVRKEKALAVNNFLNMSPEEQERYKQLQDKNMGLGD